MINTLQNSPERVPSKGGNKFKKAVALAIALTLFGEPAEAKTYEKQEFPTEMLASIPGEYTPMTENVEQATVPNYINQAENGVKKYYPQYEEYFRPIFKTLKGLGQTTNNIFNKKIHENFETFEEELTTERDKCTTILIAIDEILGQKTFIKGKKIINTEEGEEMLKGIASEITSDIKIQYAKELKEANENLKKEQEGLKKEQEGLKKEQEGLKKEQEGLKKEQEGLKKEQEKLRKIKIIRENINSKNIKPETLLKSMEDFFEIIEINEIRKDRQIQEIIKGYKNIGKRVGRSPNELGKKYIEEYNKLQ